MDKKIAKKKKTRIPSSEPVRLLVVLTASIFIVEFGIMLVLQTFIPPTDIREIFIDAFALTIIEYPIVYYFAFKPLVRKNAEEISKKETLQKIEARLQEAQQIAAVGSWDWDLSTDKHTWSNEESRIYGRNPNLPPATYEEFLTFVHPEDRKRIMDGVKATLKTGVPFQGEYRIIRPNGEERVVDGRVMRFLDEKGKPVRLAGTVHDITEHKKLEEELQEKVDDLEKANKLMVDRELKMIELKKEIEKLKKGSS